MKVLCFGSYNLGYPRNRIILKGLKKNKIEVIECKDMTPIFLLRYLKLIKKYRSDYDAMITCYLGHANVPPARMLTKLIKKPLIFDAFISLYDTYVFDRKLVKENSLKSKLYFYSDKLACMLSDVVLLDTNEHINYFHEKFGVEKKKFRRIFIGADDAVFYPQKIEMGDGAFTITFHGTFIPLQGMQYIVKAAKLLESHKDIKFEILGSGQTHAEITDLSRKLNVKNIVFKKPVNYEKVPDFIARGDVCLGIFGDTVKAKRVIPNKAFEILAMKKPLITGASPAIREAGVVNRENALLVEMANPTAIADGILELKKDEKLRNNIAKRGYELFKKNFTPKIIGGHLKRVLEEVM